MKKYNNKRKKARKVLIFDNSLLDQIANSRTLGEKEKISFLRYISYLTDIEQTELKTLI